MRSIWKIKIQMLFIIQKIHIQGKRQIARLGQLAFLCDTLKDTKKLVVF
jgi:hypothetical protein